MAKHYLTCKAYEKIRLVTMLKKYEFVSIGENQKRPRLFTLCI